MDRDEKQRFQLKVSKKEKINHDTYRMELEFPNPHWISGLKPGGHLILC